MPSLQTQSKWKNLLKTTIAFFVISVFFNNCSMVLQPLEKAGEQELNSVSEVDPAILGKKLYAVNCASCHSALSSTTKMERSSEQISAAIQTIPIMSNLRFLSSDQIDAIAKALAKPTEPVTGVSSGTFACTDRNALSAQPLKRLSKAQFVNSLTSLFGAAAVSSVASTISQIQYDKAFEQPEAYVKNFYTSNIKTFYDISVGIASYVNANSSVLAAIGGSCLTGASPDATCYENFVKNFGLKVYRRPLMSDEIAGIKEVQALASTKAEKISATLETFLQSPDFLFQVEKGTAGSGSAADPLVLSNYEVASRLSFLIWDDMPDATLFQLAAENKLLSSVVQSQQVERMFQDVRAREKVKNFSLYWLNLNPTAHTMRDFPTLPQVFLDGLPVPGLREEVIRETQEFVDYVVFTKKGSYADLLTSKASFARTDALARIYGHNKVTSQAPADMGGARSGLLMRPIFMSNSSSQSSPIIRGVRMKSRILCNDTAAPGADVTSQGIDVGTEEMIRKYSTRDRYDLKTSGAACIGCHSQINPFGHVFGGFDSFGRTISQETNYRADGSIISTHGIDTRVQLNLGNGMQSFSGVHDFIDALSQSTTGSSCFVRQTFRYYQLQSESQADSCMLSDMYGDLKADGNGSILASLKRFVLSNLSVKRIQ